MCFCVLTPSLPTAKPNHLIPKVLSVGESEALLSYLTVPYVRIPLVVGFFAAKDRSTYLFNEELQVC